MKTISRAIVRGKPLDNDCKRANVSTHEFGSNDNKCFCYGLYVPYNDWEIQQKCLECAAYVDNAKQPKDGDANDP